MDNSFRVEMAVEEVSMVGTIKWFIVETVIKKI